MERVQELIQYWQSGDADAEEFCELKDLLRDPENRGILYEELRLTSGIQQVLVSIGPLEHSDESVFGHGKRSFHSDRFYIRSRRKKSGSGKFIKVMAAAAVIAFAAFLGYRHIIPQPSEQPQVPITAEKPSPETPAKPEKVKPVRVLVGKVVACSGTVEITKGDSAVQAVSGAEMMSGDMLKTGSNSLCRIRFNDSIDIALNADTAVTFKEPGEKGEKLLTVESGEIFLNAEKQDNPCVLEMGGFDAVITGTSLFARVDAAEQRVSLVEGSIEIREPHGTVHELSGRSTALFKNGKLELRDRLVFSRINWLKDLGFEGTIDFYTDPDYDDYRSYGKGKWVIAKTENGYQISQDNSKTKLTGIMIGRPFLKEGVFTGQIRFPSEGTPIPSTESAGIKPVKTVKRSLNIPSANTDASWTSIAIHYNKGKKKSSFSFDTNYIRPLTKDQWLDFRIRFKITEEDRLITSLFLKVGDNPEERLDLDRGMGKMVPTRKLCGIGFVTNKCRVVLRNIRIYPDPGEEEPEKPE